MVVVEYNLMYLGQEYGWLFCFVDANYQRFQ